MTCGLLYGKSGTPSHMNYSIRICFCMLSSMSFQYHFLFILHFVVLFIFFSHSLLSYVLLFVIVLLCTVCACTVSSHFFLASEFTLRLLYTLMAHSSGHPLNRILVMVTYMQPLKQQASLRAHDCKWVPGGTYTRSTWKLHT